MPQSSLASIDNEHDGLSGLDLASLFPNDISFHAARSDARPATHPAEDDYVQARSFGPSRRDEFLLGRGCAQAALAALGVSRASILPAKDRAPIWPAGIVGSISHCQGYGIAAVASVRRYAGVGVDIELATEVSPAIQNLIVSPAEANRLRDTLPSDIWLAVAFSAKESAFKSLSKTLGLIPEFLDFEVRVVSEHAFLVRPAEEKSIHAASVCGRFVHGRGFLVTSAWLSSSR